MFDGDGDVVLEVEGGEVADLARLIPAVEEAMANRHPAAGVGGELFGVDGVFAGPLATFEAGGVSGQGPVQSVQRSTRTLSQGRRPRSNWIASPGDEADVAVADD